MFMSEFGLRKAGVKEAKNVDQAIVPKARGRSRWAVGGLAILGLTALLVASGCTQNDSKPPTAESVVPLVQNPAFMQCKDITYIPEVNLLRDPLIMPNGPKNPQIQHAIDTLYRNEVYDLLAIDLLPQGTKFKVGTVMQYYCLPDLVSGKARFFIQTDEGVGAGIPYGLVTAILPEGLNPIVLTRSGQRFSGSSREVQEFLFINLQAGQEAIFENFDRSYRSIIKGPLAIQTAGPTWRSMDFIQPERGFANDRPIPKK
ncbi:MAG: hypothetical protein UV33_C0050G0001 [Candidatus Daviesbacteria bacterium GW2011_GWA1_42_6]|uniref:Uncharacterized protein n=2 Tax=Candidatus Daviesiibacteriota TaxID=1752718 RepID=A0A0G1AR85_9BACT|nr:MAG: hypothetical protein UV33_C0050G0001 [Candidatus Daviesbacteria bacterium GW2011_GWA1_42_6]